MGSSPSKSKDNNPISSERDEKTNENGSVDYIKATDQGQSNDKSAAKSKPDTNEHILKATNKKHLNNKEATSPSSNRPLPPIPTDKNGSDVSEKPGNTKKKMSKKVEEQREKEERDEDQRLRQEEEKRLARITNLKEQLKSRVSGIRRDYDMVEVGFETIEDVQSDIKHLQRAFGYSTCVAPIDRKGNLHKEYVEATAKKEQLIMRISELAGARLKHNNPNIADLSDENRASQLAAKFSELYDNEYTDLFEVYCAKLPTDDREREAITHLKGSLKYIYTKCKQAADGQRKQLTSLLNMDDNVNLDTSAVGLKLRVKEFQKVVAKFTITSLQSSVHSGITEVEELKSFIDTVKPKHSGSNPHLRLYLDRCTELCWYTQIQDPPVVLDFSSGSGLSNFRSYTQTGPQLDYIVWPVLLLYEGGPVLCRGVAQFKGGANGSEGHTGDSGRHPSRGEARQKRAKREPSPYHHIPQDEIDDPTKRARTEIVETANSVW